MKINDIGGKTRIERALLDSGAEGNCMKQLLVIECGWTPLDNSIKLAIVEGKEMVTYGIYNLKIVITDSKGAIKSLRYDFMVYNFDLPDISFILGFL